MVTALFEWLAFVVLLGAVENSHHVNKGYAGLAVNHPLFISVTEFKHNQQEKILEVTCKLFADDFENTLRANYKTNIDVGHPKEVQQAERLVFDYIQKHLELKINEKPVKMQFIGFEKENESVWSYLQVNGVTQIKKLEIRNNLLYDMFSSQIGIIHASVGGNRKSIRLNAPDSNASFEW